MAIVSAVRFFIRIIFDCPIDRGVQKKSRGAVLFVLRGKRAVIDDCRSLFFDCFARDVYFDLSGFIFGAVRSKLLSVRALTRSSSTLSLSATVNQWVLFMW